MDVQLKSEVSERPMRRVSVALEPGVHEAVVSLCRRNHFRSGELVRDALLHYQPLREECERLDEVQS